MRFTTSWDDGYALDLRVGTLLSRYGLTGTFYVCPAPQYGLPLLDDDGLRALATDHEIGAHTLTHPKLTRVSPEQAKQEITGSKAEIERRAGKPCAMFCYPKGDWSPAIATLVREAGYIGARTTEPWRFAAAERFSMPTSLQLTHFPLRRAYRSWRHIIDPLGPLRVSFQPLLARGVPITTMTSWLSMATALFDRALANDEPFFHLWGHSSEIERYGMWDDLDAFLAHVAGSGAEPVTNAELAQIAA